MRYHTFMNKDQALQEAIKAEQDLASHRCSYDRVGQMYVFAAELGSEEARLWISKEKSFFPWGIPKGETRWAEILHGSDTRSSSSVGRETFYDGYSDDR